jgi:hypothetical protein
VTINIETDQAAKVVVTDVSDGGAATGLLVSGDKVVSINGCMVTDEAQGRALAKAAVGEVAFSVQRGNGILTITGTKCTPAAVLPARALPLSPLSFNHHPRLHPHPFAPPVPTVAKPETTTRLGVTIKNIRKLSFEEGADDHGAAPGLRSLSWRRSVPSPPPSASSTPLTPRPHLLPPTSSSGMPSWLSIAQEQLDETSPDATRPVPVPAQSATARTKVRRSSLKQTPSDKWAAGAVDATALPAATMPPHEVEDKAVAAAQEWLAGQVAVEESARSASGSESLTHVIVTDVADDCTASGLVVKGDTLLSINGTRVIDEAQGRALAKTAVGEVIFSGLRGGGRVDFKGARHQDARHP